MSDDVLATEGLISIFTLRKLQEQAKSLGLKVDPEMTINQLQTAVAQGLKGRRLAAEMADKPLLQWSEPSEPSFNCRYNHCIALTPFGQFRIEWKQWKEDPGSVKYLAGRIPFERENWFPVWDSLAEAQAGCEAEYRRRLMLALGGEPTPDRLRHCSTHGQQPANAWGCPECVREMRRRLASATPPTAITDRPPRPDECDAQGRVWLWSPGSNHEPPAWVLEHASAVVEWLSIPGNCCRWRPFTDIPAEEDS